MAYILTWAINTFAQILTMALVLRAIFSWFAQNPYSTLGKIYRVLINFTEPLVIPCRKLLARLHFNTGMLDFSVMLAFILVQFVARMLSVIVIGIFR